MPATKISQYGLIPVLLNLFHEGNYTETQMAEHITAYCAEHNIRDHSGNFVTVSQSSVNRELKPIRRKAESKTQKKIEEHIEAHIDSDLAAVEEATNYHFGHARTAGSYKEKSDAYMKGTRIIFEKLKTTLGGPGEEDIADQIARELEEMDPVLKEKINAIRESAGRKGISGPH